MKMPLHPTVRVAASTAAPRSVVNTQVGAESNLGDGTQPESAHMTDDIQLTV